MDRLIANLLLTIAFFTRLPIPATLAGRIPHDGNLSAAAAVFPVAGFLIGLLPAFIWFVASHLFPATVAAGLAIAVGILVTGALHEDGFADCADGLGATGNREKALEIMRDSRIGTYGTLALIISVGLRWAALSALTVSTGFVALLIAHAASRSAMTIAMKYSVYARLDGLGKQASGALEDLDFGVALALPLILGLVLGGVGGIVAVASGFLLALMFLKYLDHRLGGYTGDGLGAMQQVAEISIMIILAAFLV